MSVFVPVKDFGVRFRWLFLPCQRRLTFGFLCRLFVWVLAGLSYFAWAGAGVLILFAEVVVVVFPVGAGVSILFAEVVVLLGVGVGAVTSWAEVGIRYPGS